MPQFCGGAQFLQALEPKFPLKFFPLSGSGAGGRRGGGAAGGAISVLFNRVRMVSLWRMPRTAWISAAATGCWSAMAAPFRGRSARGRWARAGRPTMAELGVVLGLGDPRIAAGHRAPLQPARCLRASSRAHSSSNSSRYSAERPRARTKGERRSGSGAANRVASSSARSRFFAAGQGRVGPRPLAGRGLKLGFQGLPIPPTGLGRKRPRPSSLRRASRGRRGPTRAERLGQGGQGGGRARGDPWDCGGKKDLLEGPSPSQR
jgi:hypothetical protein